MDVQCGDYHLCGLFTLSLCVKGDTLVHQWYRDHGNGAGGIFFLNTFFFRSLALVFQKSPMRNNQQGSPLKKKKRGREMCYDGTQCDLRPRQDQACFREPPMQRMQVFMLKITWAKTNILNHFESNLF